MSCAVELVAEALKSGLLLSRRDERVHVDSPLGRPLLADLRRRLVEHREELLFYLEYCERADRMLLAVSERIAERVAAGCPLDGEAWRAAEQRLRVAHDSGDLPTFCEGLVAYERFAGEQIARHEAGQRQGERRQEEPDRP